jgi:hypothetical protein
VSAQIIAALRKRADLLDRAAGSGDDGPPGTVPAATLAMLAHEFRMLADEAEMPATPWADPDHDVIGDIRALGDGGDGWTLP